MDIGQAQDPNFIEGRLCPYIGTVLRCVEM